MTILISNNVTKQELKIILKGIDSRGKDNLKVNGLLFPARKIKNLIKTFKNENDFNLSVKEDYILFSWMSGTMKFKPLQE